MQRRSSRKLQIEIEFSRRNQRVRHLSRELAIPRHADVAAQSDPRSTTRGSVTRHRFEGFGVAFQTLEQFWKLRLCSWIWGRPEIKGSNMEVPVGRIMIYWGLYWGIPM